MMPATAEAFAAGDISLRHAMVLASLAGGRTTECFTRDEAILVDDARTMSWADFVRAIEYWRQHADPDGVERDAATTRLCAGSTSHPGSGAPGSWTEC